MWKKVFIGLIVLIGLGTMAFKELQPHEKPVVASHPMAKTYEPIVVLELFTSQGCSSCPAADLLLERVKRENTDKVFTLSYHVDYWNYIGWQDPFSNAAYAQRQNEYNLKLGSASNYTPEVVVNGKAHFVGSNSAKMTEYINLYGTERVPNKIELTHSEVKGDRIEFAYSTMGDLNGRTLRAVLVLDQRVTEVKRGENRNRILKNSNIVVGEVSTLLKDSNGSGTISIPNTVKINEKIHLILLVENSNHDITAATKQGLLR